MYKTKADFKQHYLNVEGILGLIKYRRYFSPKITFIVYITYLQTKSEIGDTWNMLAYQAYFVITVDDIFVTIGDMR